MLGALLGDVVGSVYEHAPIKTTDFDFFARDARYTDETVLTMAVAHAVNRKENYQFHIRQFAKTWADVPGGYGSNFKFWIYTGGSEPYNSLGIGPAARVSPVGWAFDSLQTTLTEAEASALATHSHPEAIKAARAVAHAIFLGRSGKTLHECRTILTETYGYAFQDDLAALRPSVTFDSTAPVAMPLALSCVFTARSCEDAIRTAVSLGGDADTLACVAGAVAEAYFGFPKEHSEELFKRLPDAFKNIMATFRDQRLMRAAS